MLWFYQCGESEQKEEDKNKRQRCQRRNSRDPAYSFAQDAPYIYAAFKEQYGIDLTEVEMHWWKFMALFESLNEDRIEWEKACKESEEKACKEGEENGGYQ